MLKALVRRDIFGDQQKIAVFAPLAPKTMAKGSVGQSRQRRDIPASMNAQRENGADATLSRSSNKGAPRQMARVNARLRETASGWQVEIRS